MSACTKPYILPAGKRVLAVTGHYGSGKTEFAVSLALQLAADTHLPFRRVALADLDIVNPYFRSRERKALLESSGVAVYGNAFEGEITAEIPGFSADVLGPLEDKDCLVILDVGGNDSGARVLHQIRRFVIAPDAAILAVVNANRPESRDVPRALEQLASIESELGMRVDGLVNNTHLLMETTADDVQRGHRLCRELCRITGKELWCDCYPAPLVAESELREVGDYLMPLGMFMRASWLDK